MLQYIQEIKRIKAQLRKDYCMDIQQLIYFTTIANTGTYSAAARQLYISQPALSKSIKKLEFELDTQLFVQVDKKLELTDTGRVLFQKSVPFIEEYHSIMDTMSELSMQKKGYLRLGVPYGLGKIIFDGLIADFSLEYPDITIDLCGHGSCQVMELLNTGKIDIGACIQPPKISEKFEGISLMHDRYFLLLNWSHPLANRKSVRYEELKDEQFYMLNNEYTMTQITKQNCQNAGFDPIVKMIVERSDIMGTLISKSQGIAIIAGGRHRFSNNPDLVTVELEDGINDFDILLITKKDSYLSYAAKYFLDFCKTHKLS